MIHSRRTAHHRHSYQKILDTINLRGTTLHVARTSKFLRLTLSTINQLFNTSYSIAFYNIALPSSYVYIANGAISWARWNTSELGLKPEHKWNSKRPKKRRWSTNDLGNITKSDRKPDPAGFFVVSFSNLDFLRLRDLRGCPCNNRPLAFRPKTEFLQIFRVRQLVHVINKNGNNLAFNAIFQYFWRQFQRTVQNRLNRSVSSQI